MTERDRKDMIGLDAFFDAARAAPEPADEALMARVLEDALAAQADAAVSDEAAAAPQPQRPGVLAGLFAALGGWPAVTGLATAAVAGVWIGFSPDLGVGDAMSAALGVSESAADIYLVDYVTGYDFAYEEGGAG